MRDANFTLDTLRVFLHVLSVSVWVGGQIVMASLMPVLRSSENTEFRKAIPQAFQKVAWPAFAIAVVTGIWNIFEVDMGNTTTAYSMVFGIKFLLVLVSGAAAFVHAKATKPSIKGMTGGLGLVAALAAMILGFALTH